MRILLLSAVEHQSGSALRFRGLAGALVRRGHDVFLLEPVPPDSRPETPPGVTRLPCPRLPVRPEAQAPLWTGHGAAAVRRVRPDVCWTLKALPNVSLPAALARRLGARIAVDLDDLDYGYYEPGPVRTIVKRFFDRAAETADDVTVHTEPMRELAAAVRPMGKPPVFVEQGVEIARFAGGSGRAEDRERIAPGAKQVLLYAGHLGPASDLGYLLPELGSVARDRPDARLVVVGDGRDRGHLEALAARTLPPGWATFVGTVPHADVPRYYAGADIALNPLEDNEANRYRASIKLREALAAGLPVVASRTPDAERFAEWIRLPERHGSAGFVEALLEEMEAPDRERAAEGQRWLREHGTHDVAVRDIARLWEERA
jgi:phosphatidylinositol alpha-1,6-mannosyltransferase